MNNIFDQIAKKFIFVFYLILAVTLARFETIVCNFE